MKIRCVNCGNHYYDPEEDFDNGDNFCAKCQLKDLQRRKKND